MALVAALSVLLALTAPMLALLSVTTFERLIARNLVDATQAFFAAEAGIEWAFNLLVRTPDWTVVVVPGGPQPPADLLPWGTTTVSLRDGTPADRPEAPGPGGGVIVTSTGRVNRAQRTIEATVQRAAPGPSGGAATPPAHTLVNWRER